MKFNKYWIIVFGITIVNIFIFSTFSKKLETYVYDGIVENDQVLTNKTNKKDIIKDSVNGEDKDIKNDILD